MTNSVKHSDSDINDGAIGQSANVLWLLLLVSFTLIGFIFWNGLVDMEHNWGRDEYSHGYMIPLVALYIFWQKQNAIPPLMRTGSWLGAVFVAVGLVAFFMGELATVYEIVQYGFLISLFGLFLAFFGWRPMSVVWVAFAYLIFMVPLPQFVYKALSSELQLISSSIGVFVVRLFDISVYLEGNVIDLGVYQLQVVDACSGLRYLFPLMSFGFLIAYLFKAPLWQRAFLFLSTIPITVLMNSFRIGVIGVTVEYWGIEMAEGVLHDFEGWVVFMGCLGVLLLEMLILHRFVTRSTLPLWDRVDLDIPDSLVSLKDFSINWQKQRPFIVALVLVLIAAIGKPMLEARSEPELIRENFNSFPLYYDQWIGREGSIEDNILGQLKLTDYLIADYRSRKWAAPANLYIAYYQSQRHGAQIHSPRTCIPGGGWEFDGLSQTAIPDVVNMTGQPLKVNRVVISKGKIAQVVYYWFEMRGRNITNEYAAKWYIFWDGLKENRTDGALIRVTVPVLDIDDIAQADEQAVQFIQDFYQFLPDHIPGKTVQR